MSAQAQPLKVIAGSDSSLLTIGDIEIQCYVLEDETRVLSQRGLQAAIGMGLSGGSSGAQRIARFVGAISRKGLEGHDLTARMQPIEFGPPTGGKAYGYQATFLVELCQMVLAARDAGLLLKQQEHIASKCDLLIRGLASVGIIALVDEATGYQRVRERRALATILEKYVAEDWQPWTQTFPYEFYEEIFRLRDWSGPHGVRRPSVLGHYTNDLVYKRLAPGILEELKKRNPSRPTGRRQRRHHQWFTPDFGHPRLREHLVGVIALMKASVTWNAFRRLVDRAYPKWDEPLSLPFEEEEEKP